MINFTEFLIFTYYGFMVQLPYIVRRCIYNEGIKAAAATGFGGAGAAGCWFTYDYEVPVKEINLTFDKPFLFLIRDKNSGEVWFAGTVYEPIKK